MVVVVAVAGETLERVYTVPPCGCGGPKERQHAEKWAKGKLKALRESGLIVELKEIKEK